MNESTTIEIREISDLQEMYAVEELQKEVWGEADLEVFPALAMIAMREVGAVLVGAFDRAELVGFVFGFPGLEEQQIILHSDLLAVQRDYRSHNIGYRLKLAQREGALTRGIRKITWTFDPLQSVNAHLNFARLGVVSKRYLDDFYGKTTSFLHSTGSDRLWVEWELNSARVLDRISEPAEVMMPVRDLPGSVLVAADQNCAPVTNRLNSAESDVIIEIPRHLNQLSATEIDLARRWRAVTREAFHEAISNGYCVTEFYRDKNDSVKGGRYLLRKE